MTHSTEQERVEFEAWLNPEYSRELDGMDCYIDGTVYSMFSAWLAARRAQVVPEDITSMVDAAMVEMKDYVPPLRRSDCHRLILAAIAAAPQPPGQRQCRCRSQS